PKNITDDDHPFYDGPGLQGDAFPATSSRVTVHVVDHVARELRAVALVGGLVAVTQDPDGALRPIAGWHLEPAVAHIDDVTERIKRDHRVELAGDSDEGGSGPADYIALYSHIRSATLFTGEREWRLRPLDEQPWIEIDSPNRTIYYVAQRVADLPGGDSLC